MNKYFRTKQKGRPRKTSDSDIPEQIQNAVATVMEKELEVAMDNLAPKQEAFQEYYDMLHCKRTDKQNDWESDIFLPEFPSRILTQIGNFVSQYFSFSVN